MCLLIATPSRSAEEKAQTVALLSLSAENISCTVSPVNPRRLRVVLPPAGHFDQNISLSFSPGCLRARGYGDRVSSPGRDSQKMQTARCLVLDSFSAAKFNFQSHFSVARAGRDTDLYFVFALKDALGDIFCLKALRMNKH